MTTPSKQKAPRRVLFLFGGTDFRWKSAACGRDVRFAQMWQEPTVPPQTPRGLRPLTAPPTAAAGIPLRSNVVGTCGSPTNAPWPAATDGSADRCGGTSASLKCGRNLRFPHKRPLPDCGEEVGGKAVRKILPLK